MSKNVLILGANSDIAIATAREFANHGDNIILASSNYEPLEHFAQDLKIRYGVEVSPYQFDATDYESHKEFLENIGSIDGVVLAFGYMAEQIDAQNNFTKAKKMVDVNYLGAISILELIAASFEEKKGGFIVGISSVAGDRGRKANYLYGSTKAALSAYLSGLRNRLFESNVKVITVKPGFVATKMTEHLELPAALTASKEQVASDIYKAVEKNIDVLYTKSIWRLVMWVIKHIPEFQFKKMSI